MKRLLKLLITPLLVIPLLMACSVKGSSTPTIAAPPDVTVEIEITRTTATKTQIPVQTITPSKGEHLALAKGQTINFWHSYSINSIDLVDQLISEFNETNPEGIQVESHSFLSDGQLQNGLAQETLTEIPDVIMGETSLLKAFDRTSSLTVLDPFIADSIIGLPQKQHSTIPFTYWDELTLDRDLIGIPAQRSGYFLIYNLSWANELGYSEPPPDWSGFTDQLKAAFEANIIGSKNMRGTGGWFIDEHPETPLAWAGYFGTPEQPWDVLADPVIPKVFNDIKELQQAGYAWAGKNSDPVPYFVNRQALFVSSSSQELPEMISHLAALGMADDWTVISYPHKNAGAKNISKGYGYGIPAQDEAKQMAAWLFIRWMMDPARQAKISALEYTSPSDSQASIMLPNTTGYPRIYRAVDAINQDSANLPDGGNWLIFRTILADGWQQLLQPQTTVDQIPGIIQTMQEMLSEYPK